MRRMIDKPVMLLPQPDSPTTPSWVLNWVFRLRTSRTGPPRPLPDFSALARRLALSCATMVAPLGHRHVGLGLCAESCSRSRSLVAEITAALCDRWRVAKYPNLCNSSTCWRRRIPQPVDILNRQSSASAPIDCATVSGTGLDPRLAHHSPDCTELDRRIQVLVGTRIPYGCGTRSSCGSWELSRQAPRGSPAMLLLRKVAGRGLRRHLGCASLGSRR